MEFVNTPYCGIADCNCINFVQDLFILCKEILTIEDVLQQWTAFKRFKRQVLRNYRSDKSFSMCFMLLYRIKKLIDQGLTLSTLLLDLIPATYFHSSGHFVGYLFIKDIQKTHFLNDRETLQALAAFCTKPELMKLLLNFGYISSLREESHLLRSETFRIIDNFIWSLKSPDSTYSIFEEIVKLLKKSLFASNGKAAIYKGLYLAGCALHAIKDSLKRDHVQAEKFINCLKMYFCATRDPFLTIFEVRCVLYALLSLLNMLELFDQYSEVFDRLMPKCPARTEPRKLTDLVRCQVRQSLKMSNFPLPVAVEKLGLPKLLKSFVVGDVMNISRKSRNVSPENVVTKSELARFLFKRPMC